MELERVQPAVRVATEGGDGVRKGAEELGAGVLRRFREGGARFPAARFRASGRWRAGQKSGNRQLERDGEVRLGPLRGRADEWV